MKRKMFKVLAIAGQCFFLLWGLHFKWLPKERRLIDETDEFRLVETYRLL